MDTDRGLAELPPAWSQLGGRGKTAVRLGLLRLDTGAPVV